MSAAAKEWKGRSRGRNEAICQLPSRRRRGRRPAKIIEDLPLPEGPTTATKGFLRTPEINCSVNESLPKKKVSSRSRNGYRPRYGQKGMFWIEMPPILDEANLFPSTMEKVWDKASVASGSFLKKSYLRSRAGNSRNFPNSVFGVRGWLVKRR